MNKNYPQLRILHGVAGFLHLAQAGALTYLVQDNISKGSYKWPITSLGWQTVKTSASFDLGILVPMFSALSATNHVTSFAAYDWYDKEILKKEQNWLRWTEYSVSAGLMIFIIAILSGVTEIRTLTSLLVQNIVLQMMGLLIEKRKAEKAPPAELLVLFGIAWGIFISMWIPIIISFYNVIDETTGVPPAVHAIIWSMFTLFASFGVAQALYVFDVCSFETYEKILIGLSLTSKSILSWLVYGGVLAADVRFENEKDK